MSTAPLTLGHVEQELAAIDAAAEERYRRLGGLCRHYLHAVQRLVRSIERGEPVHAEEIDRLREDMLADGRRIRPEHRRAWDETTPFVESSIQRLGVLHEVRRRLAAHRDGIRREDTLLPKPVEIDLPNGKSGGQTLFFQSRRVEEDVWGKLRLMAELDAPVLFLGESGTGKTMFAKALRKHSTRAEKPFLALNCATLQDQLLENELFGHEKGAYTGADRSTKGKIDEAENGIFFLDEIGEMSLAVQSKILTLLEDGTFYRPTASARTATCPASSGRRSSGKTSSTGSKHPRYACRAGTNARTARSWSTACSPGAPPRPRSRRRRPNSWPRPGCRGTSARRRTRSIRHGCWRCSGCARQRRPRASIRR